MTDIWIGLLCHYIWSLILWRQTQIPVEAQMWLVKYTGKAEGKEGYIMAGSTTAQLCLDCLAGKLKRCVHCVRKLRRLYLQGNLLHR